MSKSFGRICGSKNATIVKPPKQGVAHKHKMNLKKLKAMEQIFNELHEKYGNVEISPETLGEEDYNRLINILESVKAMK